MKLIEVNNQEEIASLMSGFLLEEVEANEDKELLIGLGYGPNITLFLKSVNDLIDDYEIDPKQVQFVALNHFDGESKSGFEKYYTDLLPNGNFKYAKDQVYDLDLCIVDLGLKGNISLKYDGLSFEDGLDNLKIDIINNDDIAEIFDQNYVGLYDYGFDNIFQAKKIFVLASRPGIEKTVKELFEGYESTQLPASRLFNHEDTTVIGDEQALKLLD